MVGVEIDWAQEMKTGNGGQLMGEERDVRLSIGKMREGADTAADRAELCPRRSGVQGRLTDIHPWQ